MYVVLQVYFVDVILSIQEVEASRELVYSQAVRNAGIIYLEHEQVDVSLVNGIKWKIYGSPVYLTFFSLLYLHHKTLGSSVIRRRCFPILWERRGRR